VSSFTVTVIDAVTNTEAFTPMSSIAAGQDLVLYWGSGTAFGGNPTQPTSITDNNGNTYIPVSLTTPGQPPQATTGLFLCVNPVLTPNNPPTITCSGATGVPSGGPSIIFLGIAVPTAYDLYGANCSGYFPGTGNSLNLDVGTVAGVGTTPLVFNILPGDNGTQCAIIFVSRSSDVLALLGAYYFQNAVVTWSTTGTGVLAYTTETGDGGGHSGAVAYLNASMTEDACGYVAPALAITCNSPPAGTEGVPYSHQFGPATGGTPPYTYSLTGSVPGLAFSTSTGVISGTPTTPGTYSLTVGVTDAAMGTASVPCSIVIAAPSTPTALCNTPPGGTVGVAYSHQFGASGGTPPYSYLIVAGALPPGITMNSAGLASGTPTTAGTFNFTVQVTDANGNTNPVMCSITIENPTPGPTDTQFFLTHIAIGLKQARLPVRGSAT
jgi:putative Ig domain-containing protein